MRKILFLLFGLMIVGVGCLSTQPAELQKEDVVGITNLAEVYCEENGGKIKIAESADGSGRYCGFPDGSFCEEQEYYRGECGSAKE